MKYYRAKDLNNNWVYGYPIIVPALPFPSTPEGEEAIAPIIKSFMFSNITESYRDLEDYPKTEIQKDTIQYYIGEAGNNSVGLFEGDIITATIYPFENFNALIIWNEEKKMYMLEYHKKKTYTGRGIFDGMQREIKFLQNANIDIIGNSIDNRDLL